MTQQLDHRVVTITKGIRGYFAVVMNVYEDGWAEPEVTGFFSAEYPTHPELLDEAKEMAYIYKCHFLM